MTEERRKIIECLAWELFYLEEQKSDHEKKLITINRRIERLEESINFLKKESTDD